MSEFFPCFISLLFSSSPLGTVLLLRRASYLLLFSHVFLRVSRSSNRSLLLCMCFPSNNPQPLSHRFVAYFRQDCCRGKFRFTFFWLRDFDLHMLGL
ncbi:hypothetical protein OROHE_021696 [Orobanche hederae]